MFGVELCGRGVVWSVVEQSSLCILVSYNRDDFTMDLMRNCLVLWRTLTVWACVLVHLVWSGLACSRILVLRMMVLCAVN